MDRVRYKFCRGGFRDERNEAREHLQLVYQLANIERERKSIQSIEMPLRAIEVSQLGIMIFTQTVQRIAGPYDLMYSRFGASFAEVGVTFRPQSEVLPQGTLCVRFPLTVIGNGLGAGNVETTLEMDRRVFGSWFLPLASKLEINVHWERADETRVGSKKYYFATTPLNEW